MKKLLFALIIIGLIAGGCAKEAEARGRDVCDTHWGAILNKCVEHPSEDEESAEIGIGINLILLEGSVDEVSYTIIGEYRYDINNSEHSAYGVVTLKLKEIANAIKGLFSKDE